MKGTRVGLPKRWTNAKVRVNSAGKVQILMSGAKLTKPNPRKKRNESVAMGFWRGGVFHPIRSSDDYDPEAVGEKHQYAPRKKKARRRKR